MTKMDGQLREMGLPELRSLMDDSSIQAFFNQRCSLVHERRKLLLEVRCTPPPPPPNSAAEGCVAHST